MRVIAGAFGGRSLKAPKGEGTRPTTDRVRESMMSAIASARGGFDGASVLDAFAGSGALGIEALSRGARCAHFYERAPEASRVLLENVRAMGLDPRCARVHRADILKEPPVRAQPSFDLVFLDPPYAFAATEALGVVAHLRSVGALAEDPIVVYEHAAGDEMQVDDAAKACDLSLARRKKYGDTVVDVLRTVRTEDAGTATERERHLS